MEILDYESDNQPHNPADNKAAIWGYLLVVFSNFAGILGFIGVIVYYVMNRDKSHFVRHHAAQALNTLITSVLLGIIIVLGVGAFVGFSSPDLTGTSPEVIADSGVNGLLFGIIAAIILLIVTSLAAIITSIIGAVKANNGEYWKNPLAFPFVKE